MVARKIEKLFSACVTNAELRRPRYAALNEDERGCRTLTFTANSWPLTGTGLGELRYAFTATTGLSAPYLANTAFPLATLKKPYLNQYSYQAINFADVGVTTGTAFIGATIGSKVSSSLYAYSFNLFDAHGSFISAVNSNITFSNNVFQNTQRYYIPPIGISAGQMYGGNAINDENYYMNSKLDLTSSSVDLGNRFWNCHTGIKALYLLRLNIEKALFRSTQLNTASGPQQGTNGLQLSTNRFQYFIKDNEFTNIAYPINIPIAANVYTTISTGTQTGIYADKIIVLQNTFASGGTSGQNINTAINITCPNQFPFTMANDYLVVPYTKAIVVEQNTMTAVERAVAINGITGFQTTIESNSITLRGASSSQHGIDLSNCLSANNAVGQFMVITNTISGAAPSASLESLVYCSGNTGIYSPSVTCNSVSNSYQGFLFQGTNPQTVWAGNKMQPLTRGLVLSGMIGTQGTNANASNNEWRSTWASNTNYGTWVISGNNAASSYLWVKGGSLYPPNNDGSAQPINQYGASNTLSVATGGDYQCGGGPNNRVFPLPNTDDYEDEGRFYVAKTATYRYLHFNDSILSSDLIYGNFYTDQAGSNLDLFVQIEEELYSGHVTEAQTMLNDLSTDGVNLAEDNTKLFYGLYLNYLRLDEDEAFAETDSTSLLNLASSCPITGGAAVFQAQALFNSIYKIVLNYPDCDEPTGARPANETFLAPQNNFNNSQLSIFPNPNSGKITLLSSKENDELFYTIKDISGRILKTDKIICKGFSCFVDTHLTNGVYFISLQSSEGQFQTVKLIVQN